MVTPNKKEQYQLFQYSFFNFIESSLKETLGTADIKLKINVNFNDRGDFTLPLFEISKHQKVDMEILVQRIQQFFVDKKYISLSYKNGFLDFYLEPLYIIQEKDNRGFIYKNDYPEKIIFEYSSPNIAKPFTIGHLRSTDIGNALANVFEYTGDKVIRLNYLGDWGTQFGKLLYAYNKYYNSQNPLNLYTLNDLYIRFHNEAEKNKEIESAAQMLFNELEKGDEKLYKLWERFYSISLEYFDEIYKKLNVQFNDIERESMYIQKAKAITQEILQKGIARISQDAIIVDMENENMGVAILQKKDESTIYFSRDLAALFSRFERYNFDRIYYVVGKEQQLHFKQLCNVAQKVNGLLKGKVVHIPFGHFRLKGEKIATREGRIIYFEEVLEKGIEKIMQKEDKAEQDERKAEKIALSALKYYDLKNRIIKDIDFSWEEALQFDGNTGPYILYGLVRIKSLFRNFKIKFGKEPDFEKVDLKKIITKEQIIYLMRKILLYYDFILLAKSNTEPSILCNYIFDLLKIFNNYYQTVRIITSDENESVNNLYPFLLLGQVLRTYIHLLGLEEIEVM